MIERDLPFTKSVAQRLMQIGSDPRLAKAVHARLLPNAWTTLSELTKLPTPTFERATALRIINPKMTRADAKVINLAITRDTKPIGPVHNITPLLRGTSHPAVADRWLVKLRLLMLKP